MATRLATFARNFVRATPTVIGSPTRSATSRRSRAAISGAGPAIRRRPATSRNASSIEMPSTSGLVSRNTSKTARLAAVYAANRGGTTTRPRAHPPGQPAAHRRAHPVGLRLVARREHDPAAHDDRPSAQPHVVPLLDRGIEGVEIGVEDGRLGHEQMFEHIRASSVNHVRCQLVEAG